MVKTSCVIVKAFILSLLLGDVCSAQDDNRNQYPGWLSKSYFDFNIGHISYPFSEIQLEPGYRSELIRIPHAAVQVTLFGHRLGKTLSGQVSYMRPIQWITYNINGSSSGRHPVFMNVGSLTIRSTIPIRGPFSIYTQGGLGVITRRGFRINDLEVVKDANYATIILGTGLQYHLNNKWDLQTSIIYLPANKNIRQPYTMMFSGGAVFNIRHLSVEPTKSNNHSTYIFPENLFQISYATNKFGIGINDFVSGKVPIFWGGNVKVLQGRSFRYERNIFHTNKIFSFDWGISVANWSSARDRINFSTVSLYPKFRFTPVRLKLADFYLAYSLAGPTFISKTLVDGQDLGKKFTFQDLIGLGSYIGKQRHINVEAGIGHYSNGNLFIRNPGVMIPLTLSLGYAF